MVPQQQRRRRRRAALPRTAERRVVVSRGAGGFGFTIAGQRPCVVSAVAAGGPAERAGLRAGDALIAVDGASVARAPHASVARLVATAPGAISLSVAQREAPPTDTEDTEPDERSRARRRHPPPRRRPQPMLHHPACHAVPSTSGVNEILQNLSRAQLTPSHASRLECRAVVGYLGTIETPQAASTAAPSNVRSAVRKLRQERRPATPVLLSVLPNVLLLRRPTCQVLAQYQRERILYAGCGSESDRRFFGLVTSSDIPEAEASHSSHIFAVDPRMTEHDAHAARAREFQIACTRDPVAERCLEFPPSAEYVVGVIRGMYSLPADDCASPTLLQISKLAIKGDSPAGGNCSRFSRSVFRVPRVDRRACLRDEPLLEGPEFVANSPQPSNHSEITTTSSNSDSGIGFHNDGRNIADRILVVDFAGQQPPPNRFREEMPRRPIGLVGCSSFDAEASFLSNTTPVVDGFGGQGRPLNLDDVILNANDLQPVRGVSPRAEEDNYNYNNVYVNVPSTSRNYNGVVYDQVYTEDEAHYNLVPQLDIDLELNRVSEALNSVEIYEERCQADCQSNESVENETVISGGTSKASMDSVSVYSSRSHEEARPCLRKHLQASLDDMLVIGMRERDRDQPPPRDKDEGTFLHPASVKCKVRKSIKPLNILLRTCDMLTGKDKKDRRRAMSASAGDVDAPPGLEAQPPLPAAASEPDLRDTQDRRRAISASAGDVDAPPGLDAQPSLPAAASEPDLRDTQSEQSSPFRRWTTSSGGGGSSYRHVGHRALYKQMSKESVPEASSSGPGSQAQWQAGPVTRWALGLEQLLADPVGSQAFAAFLANEFASENITFYFKCETYKNLKNPQERASLAKEIWEKHLEERAREPINIDASARRHTLNLMKEDPLPENLFQQAQRQIFNVLRLDAYPRFLRSREHADCARANLQGQSPPAAFAPPAANSDSRAMSPQPGASGQQACSGNQAGSAPNTPSKLKKSASNASDRRRSGGPSLLWKLRVPSRERGAGSSDAGPSDHRPGPTGPAIASASSFDSILTDVVKFAPLCRVVLPDGATSVVGVDPAVTVSRLVDRLLQRRHLDAVHYDVLYKDSRAAESGGGEVIDQNAPSTVLGGREVVVEKRSVVRFDVRGRVVAVRCRPAHQLRHVLRPVLARYSPAHCATAVLHNGRAVHPHTAMLDLDGARLQVVEVEGGGGFEDSQPPSRRDSGPEPADTPAGVASLLLELVCKGDDDHIGDARRSTVNGGDTGSRAIAGTAAIPGAGNTGTAVDSDAARATNHARSRVAGGDALPPDGVVPTHGRVRAALRSGHPLHTHPPNFLDNLRETQRQRLQSAESSAAPRTPPPLPPKPRAPTLV